MTAQAGVVALAFGIKGPKMFSDGNIPPNVCVGRLATAQACRLNAPVFRQLHIRVAEGIETTEAVEAHTHGGANTLMMAHQAIDWAVARGYTELYIAAATPHLWRCLRDFRETVKERGLRIKIAACPNTLKYTSKDWYCRASAQKRTRSPWVWWPWELALRLMPFWLYKKLSVRDS